MLRKRILNPEGPFYDYLISKKKRLWLKIFLDFSVVMICAPIAVYIRMGHLAAIDLNLVFLYSGIAIAPKLLGLSFFTVHRQSWHNVGIRDLYKIISAVALSFILIIAAMIVLRSYAVIPWGVPFIDAILSVFALGSTRLIARLSAEQSEFFLRGGKKAKQVLIVGAGRAGTMMAREMLRHPENAMKPVAFLDDDPAKQRQRFLDIPVHGPLDELESAVNKYNVDLVLIAIPSSPESIRKVVHLSSKVKVKYQILPRLSDILHGKVSISQIRDVDVQDLLHREAIDLDLDEIARYIKGKKVLVTGAGGSIGSEIVRQVCRFSPETLYILGRGENSIYDLQKELGRYHSQIPYKAFIADVRDEVSLRRIFENHKPEIVFHAAAHKHVPLMEENPEQAVLNNILGTLNLVKLSLKYGIERFVNISTDKAVNPTSVMGASKRVAEYVVEQGAEKAKSNQVFVSVRFGNVLGSRGSVIPLFKEQINRGGPVTVTHQDMTRYFMTIPEASKLVLQAGGMDQNGAVYVLDMGEPVRIVDIAKDLISLSGLKPGEDIEIKFTGTRPGEKLFEEILTAEEGTISSKYEKIFVARKNGVSIEELDSKLEKLFKATNDGDTDRIRYHFSEMVPNFSIAEQKAH